MQETVDTMKQIARLMGIEPGEVRILNDWHAPTAAEYNTFNWYMDECEKPISGRVHVYHHEDVHLALVRSFTEALSRSLRASGAYEWAAKRIYYDTPHDLKGYTWMTDIENRHSSKTLINDLVLYRAMNVINMGAMVTGPTPWPGEALEASLEWIEKESILKDLKIYFKRVGADEDV